MLRQVGTSLDKNKRNKLYFLGLPALKRWKFFVRHFDLFQSRYCYRSPRKRAWTGRPNAGLHQAGGRSQNYWDPVTWLVSNRQRVSENAGRSPTSFRHG